MNFLNKTAQWVGEGVGAFEKTEETEDFKNQEKYFHSAAEATQKVVTELIPESASGIKTEVSGFIHQFSGKENTLRTAETKRGELFIGLGQDLSSNSVHSSSYAEALISLGESLKAIGEAHSMHDVSLMENSIGPLKIFNENVLKEIQKLEKSYETRRLEYDAVRRQGKKKVDAATQQKIDQKKKYYEDARIVYLEKVQTLPNLEKDQVKQLKDYCKAQADYSRSIAELYERAASNLSSIKSEEYHPPPISHSTSSSSSMSQSTSGYSTGAPAPAGGIPPPRQPPRPESQKQCQALYAFVAESPTELSFNAGDLINIRKQVNADWYEGELHGKIGLLPTNYVQLL